MSLFIHLTASARRWAAAWGLLAATALPAAAQAQHFTVQGTRILDPSGQEFIPKGANIGLWTNQATAAEANRVKNVWKFNTVRIYLRLAGNASAYPSDALLDAYVNQYASTANGPRTVVMFECHDFSGGYYTASSTPSLTDLRNFWKRAAARYKDNPYVWFNIMNEPGAPGPVDAQWYSLHKTLVQDIRAQGANNVVVVDGNGFASEDGNGTTKASPVKDATSGILTYGPQLLQDDPRRNLVFGLHCYNDWRYSPDKLYNFVDRVQAKNLALVIGEYASHTGNSMGEYPVTGSALAALEVAPARKVGALVWHYSNGDGNALATGPYGGAGGEEIDRTDGARPTNLSWLGERVWDYTHGAPLAPQRGVPLDRYAWTASSSRGGNAALGIDADGDSQFGLDSPTAADWYKVDLGARRAFNRVLIDTRKSPAGFMRAGKVYLSDDATSDGQLIATVAGNKMAVNDLALGSTATGRYLTIRPTEFGKNAKGATFVSWVIADLQLFATGTHTAPQLGTVALDRAAWKGYASKRSGWDQEWEAKAYDASADSRYTSGANTVRGDWYYLDLGTTQTFQSVYLSAGSSASNHARKLQVFVSNDVNNWGAPVAEVLGSAITKIVLPAPQTGRYVRFVSASDIGDWWTIHDIKLYAPTTGTPPAGGATLTTGVYTLAAKVSAGGGPVRVLDVAGANDANGRRLPVIQAKQAGKPTQLWTLTKQSDGYYTIATQFGGGPRVLDVVNSGKIKGTEVQLYWGNNSDAQRFKIEADGNTGYYIVTPKHADQDAGLPKKLRLDVRGGTNADNTQVWLWEDNGLAPQRWKIEAVAATAGRQAEGTAASLPAPSTADPTLSVYPNPNHGEATLVLTAQEAQSAVVYVRDRQGLLVALLSVPAKAGVTEWKLPTTLPLGTYFVQTRLDGQTQHFTLKVE